MFMDVSNNIDKNLFIREQANVAAKKTINVILSDNENHVADINGFIETSYLEYLFEFGHRYTDCCVEVLRDSLRDSWDKTGNWVFGLGAGLYMHTKSQSLLIREDEKEEYKKFLDFLFVTYYQPYMLLNKKGLLIRDSCASPYVKMREFDLELFAYDRALLMQLLKEIIVWIV